MKNLNLIKSKYDSFLMLLLVLSGGSLIKQSRLLSLILLAITFIYVVFLILKYKKTILKSNFFPLANTLIFLLLLFTLQMLFLENNLFSNQYITYTLQFTTVLLVIYYIKTTNVIFSYKLYFILKIFMFHALLSFIVWFIFKGLMFTFQLDDYKIDSLFYIFFYSNTIGNHAADYHYVHLLGISFIRNQGLFWEPGVLQIYMNLLLFLSLNYYQNRNITILTIFVLITAWSTTGMIILLIQISLYFVKNLKYKRFAILFPLILSVIIAIGFVASDNILEKMNGDKKGSSVQRKIDTLSTLNIIEHYPFFGIGLDSKNYFYMLDKYTVLIHGEQGAADNQSGVSNSLLYLFVYFGIPLGLFFLYSLYNQTLLKKSRSILFLIILIASLTEPILLLTFFTLFIASGIENNLNLKGNKT